MRALAMALLFIGCAPKGRVTAVSKEDIQWKVADGSATGVTTSIEYGDPQRGPHQALMNFPAGTLVPPHFHKVDEFSTVISGSIFVGQGEAIDESKGVEIAAGGYLTIPGGTAHWEKCIGGARLVRFAPGPHDSVYLEEGEKSPGTQPLRIVQPKEIPWEDAPAPAKGVKTALQYGDTVKGPYIMLIKFPGGQVNPPHYHSADETVSILSGTMIIGEGQSIDDAKGKAVPAGGYLVVPGHTPHWGKVPQDGVTLTRLGNGPLDIFYFDKK